MSWMRWHALNELVYVGSSVMRWISWHALDALACVGLGAIAFVAAFRCDVSGFVYSLPRVDVCGVCV